MTDYALDPISPLSSFPPAGGLRKRRAFSPTILSEQWRNLKFRLSSQRPDLRDGKCTASPRIPLLRRIQPVRSRNRNARFELDLTRSRRHPRTRSGTLGSCTASSSHGRNPSRGHWRKQAIGFDPNQRLAGSSTALAYWHCWHSCAVAQVPIVPRTSVLARDYALRNVVCLQASRGRSGLPALLEATVGRGVKGISPPHIAKPLF